MTVSKPTRGRSGETRSGRRASNGLSPNVLARIGRDVATGLASGELRETPTLFIHGNLHRRGYDAVSLVAALQGGREPEPWTASAPE